MNTEIYYFSGTGNSLAVARDIAGRIGERLRSIPAVMNSESIRGEAGAMGMVFPVYHKSIPLIVKKFVEKLEGLDERYLFAVCTYGDSPGLAIEHLAQLIQSRGGRLAAGFGVHLPYNYLTPSFTLKNFLGSFTLREISVEKQKALFAAAQEKIEEITAFIRARRSGTFETTSDIFTRLADALHLEETLGKSTWLKVAGVDEPTKLSFLESRQLMDRGFRADESCNGCAICSRICPVSNIEMADGRPVWQQRCEQCFACLQWCPQESIQFGDDTTRGKRRYHHPDVTLADMLRQASPESSARTSI